MAIFRLDARTGNKTVGMRCFVWFIVMAGGTGQPGRPCGRHKISLSEVQWLEVDRPQILDGLECQTSLMKLMIIKENVCRSNLGIAA